MSLTKYIYNVKTLRYERAPIHWGRTLLLAMGILCTGFVIFVGLVVLQNFLIESPEERALRAENEALVTFKSQLEVQLVAAHSALSDLEQKDKSLYEKIFDVKRVDEQKTVIGKELFLADASEFRTVLGSLLDRSASLRTTAQARNYYFGEHTSIAKGDISRLASLPSISPVRDLDATKLVSGYGKRINPFHKGMYFHDGIDIAAARGTDVVAAGTGTVIAVSVSALQAGFGTYVVINHGNGFITQYANLGSVSVRYGQKISKGQPIGTIGMSGGSIAPHVHYQVMQNGKNVDPVKYLMGGLTADAYEQVWIASQKQNQSLD